VSELSQAKFLAFLQDRENRGWEYNGTTPVQNEGRAAVVWVFRRPVKGAGQSGQSGSRTLRSTQPVRPSPDFVPIDLAVVPTRNLPIVPTTGTDDPKAIEAEIARLQEKLAKLRVNRQHVSFPRSTLPLEPKEMMDVLEKLAGRKFAKGRYSLKITGDSLFVEGDREVVEWLRERVRALGDQ
jgi:hypothetical protein